MENEASLACRHNNHHRVLAAAAAAAEVVIIVRIDLMTFFVYCVQHEEDFPQTVNINLIDFTA